MHTIYRLYNVLCSLHLIVSILFLMSGFNGSFTFLTINHNDGHHSLFPNTEHSHYSDEHLIELNTNNGTDQYYYSYVVFIENNSLSGTYFIASISAAIYSAIYLSLAQTSDSNREESLRFLAIPYDNESGTGGGEVEDLLESPVSAHTQNILLISEIFYWSFVISYSYIAIASNTRELGSLELFYLRWIVHLFCVYTIICSPNPKKRRVDIASSIAFVAFIAETFMVISMARTQRNIVVAYFHRFLDLLLLLGHRWDANPSWEIILNCRLMYVAMGGALLHVDILFSTLY
jgi:hypothetical protein